MPNLCGQKVMHIRTERMISLDKFLNKSTGGSGIEVEGLTDKPLSGIVLQGRGLRLGNLQSVQNFSCLLGGRHFPSELLGDPNNPINKFSVTLGKNTF